MKFLVIIFLAVAFVSFLFYAFRRPSPNPAVSLGIGLAAWVCSELLAAFLKAFPLIIVGCLLFFSGCSTATSDPLKNERNAALNAGGSEALKNAAKILGSALTAALFQSAEADMSGSKVNADFGHAAAANVWTQLNFQTASSAYNDVVSAASEGRLRQTAKEAQKAAASALAAGHSPAEVSGAIASVISTVASAK